MGVIEPTTMQGFKAIRPIWVSLDVTIPSQGGITPEQWNQQHTLLKLHCKNTGESSNFPAGSSDDVPCSWSCSISRQAKRTAAARCSTRTTQPGFLLLENSWTDTVQDDKNFYKNNTMLRMAYTTPSLSSSLSLSCLTPEWRWFPLAMRDFAVLGSSVSTLSLTLRKSSGPSIRLILLYLGLFSLVALSWFAFFVLSFPLLLWLVFVGFCSVVVASLVRLVASLAGGFFPSNARWLSPGHLTNRKDNCILQIQRIRSVATSVLSTVCNQKRTELDRNTIHWAVTVQ